MKTLKNLSLVSLICLFFFISCDDENKGCGQIGYCFAEGSYQDYNGDYVYFNTSLVQTTNQKWIRQGGVHLTTVDSYCYGENLISLMDIPFNLNDTIFFNISNIYPVKFKIMDYDVEADEYSIIKDEKIQSWLVIDKINVDTSEISGTFQLSFERTARYEKWDDPNRPDTLHFTNGVFEAVAAN